MVNASDSKGINFSFSTIFVWSKTTQREITYPGLQMFGCTECFSKIGAGTEELFNLIDNRASLTLMKPYAPTRVQKRSVYVNASFLGKRNTGLDKETGQVLNPTPPSSPVLIGLITWSWRWHGFQSALFTLREWLYFWVAQPCPWESFGGEKKKIFKIRERWPCVEGDRVSVKKQRDWSHFPSKWGSEGVGNSKKNSVFGIHPTGVSRNPL